MNNTEKGYADMTKVIESQNKDRVKFVRQQLKENGGYCPCRLIQNESTKCICKEFRSAIEMHKLGKCHCGLYEVVEINEDEAEEKQNSQQ